MAKYGGTGLGMWITKKIVELHDGTIECQSAKNNGTTFCVRMEVQVASQ